jgi:imidazole glycerol-phosphate synthase subunit HisH
MAEVTIVSYGVGNILAFANIYKRMGVTFEIGDTVEKIKEAKRLILPGVGAFDWAMKRLNESGLRDTLDRKVLADAAPVIGVCVGMQMMVNSSDEGQLAGLGWIQGHVQRMVQGGGNSKVPLPHMGWNDVTAGKKALLFQGLEDLRYYFLHSYAVKPSSEGTTYAKSTYGDTFVSAIMRDNIYGVQFHPEKSHHWGVQLLKNFVSI